MNALSEILIRLCPLPSIRRHRRCCRRIRFYAEELLKKKRSLEAVAAETETLVLGSSHAEFGILAEMLENAFNLGTNSQDLFTSAMLFARWKSSMPKLRQTILTLSVFSPGSDLSKTKDVYRAVANACVLEIPMKEDSRLPEWEIREFRKICGETEKEFSASAPCAGTPVSPPPSVTELPKMDVTARAKKHLRENRRTPDQLSWLERLLRDSGTTETLVVIPPAREDYRKELPPKDELFGKAKKIVLSGGNARILDFFDDPDFSDGDFVDADHLNDAGARKLTEKIRGFLNR